MFEPAALTRVKSILSSGGDISVRDLRQLRTEVRLAKAKPKITATQDDVALGRLEKSLTDDLYKAVAATSGKDAAQSLRVADRAYARTLGRVGGPLSKFAGPNATDEQAFAAIRQAMTGQTASRGVGNANQIKELRRALSPSDLKEVQAGLFRGMGRATEGAEFSAEHFVMQWQKFGNTQKNLMFGTGEIRKDMDALVRVMKAQSRSHVANHSKSGVSVQNVASLAGLANPATMTQTATLLGGANMTGRLLTNPRYVKAVRSVVEAEYQAGLKNTAKSASDLLRAKKKALVTVAAIEKADDSLKDELAQFRVYLTLEGAQ